MPLYEYECPRTGKRFEVIQRFSDAPITKCDDCNQYPDCEGECRKILSAPAIQFKGSGWYVTDYAGKGKDTSSSKGDDGGSSDGSKSDSSKSDSSKPDSSKSDSSSKSEKKDSSSSSKGSSSSKSDS